MTTWAYKGIIARNESGGVGSYGWTYWAQGAFETCSLWTGCVTQMYPWIEQRADYACPYQRYGGV